MKKIVIGIYFWAFIAGICDAAMDARRDYINDTIFSRAFTGSLHDWYIGGNEKYSWPVENFFPYDFWHSAKHLRNLSIALSIFWAMCYGYIKRTLHSSLYIFETIEGKTHQKSKYMFWSFIISNYIVFTASFTLFYKIIWRL